MQVRSCRVRLVLMLAIRALREGQLESETESEPQSGVRHHDVSYPRSRGGCAKVLLLMTLAYEAERRPTRLLLRSDKLVFSPLIA